MELIDRDELNDISISESAVFSRLIDFQSGRTDMNETAGLIVSDVMEDIKTALDKQPVLMNGYEYVIAKGMLVRLVKKMDEAILNGVSDSITSK